ISWGAMVHTCLKAADSLARDGISAEVLDLRTLTPLDLEALLATVEKTGRGAVRPHRRARPAQAEGPRAPHRRLGHPHAAVPARALLHPGRRPRGPGRPRASLFLRMGADSLMPWIDRAIALGNHWYGVYDAAKKAHPGFDVCVYLSAFSGDFW